MNSEAKIFKNNVLLVGDAAGLADPIFKGGISQAMCSANIAAQCILKDKTHLYQTKIDSMPFSSPKLIKASKNFFNLENQSFNELGEVLEGETKEISYLLTIQGILKFVSKPNLRKNFLKIFNFFSIWKKNQDYLW